MKQSSSEKIISNYTYLVYSTTGQVNVYTHNAALNEWLQVDCYALLDFRRHIQLPVIM